MKKLLCLVALCVLSACAQTNQDELRACMTDQAKKMVNSGAVAAAPMRTSVKKVLKACGVQNQTQETKEMAQAIIMAEMK